MTQQLKHPQHIVAFDKERFGYESYQGLESNPKDTIGGGFTAIDVKDFWERCMASAVIARRHELETDERFAQFLPYIVLWRKARANAHAVTHTEVFAYRRTSKVGESRLSGNYSVGIGGHVDLADVAHNDSKLDMLMTAARAISRELNEEVKFARYTEGEDDDQAMSFDMLRTTRVAFPEFRGVINDDMNPVGRVHLGAVFALEIPAHFEPVCVESELETVGWVKPEDLLKERVGMDLNIIEPWSLLVLQNIDRIIR